MPISYLICVFTFLAASCIYDVKTSKVPNKLSGSFFITAFFVWAAQFWLPLSSCYSPSWWTGPFLALIALALGLVLFQTKVIGGGDSKLLPSIGLLSFDMSFFESFFIAFLCWFVVFGLIFVLIQGSLLQTLKNLIKLEKNKSKLHQLPLTVAIFLAWLSAVQLHWSRLMC